MNIGLCGFPKVGKTSVFEAVTGLLSDAHAHSTNLAAVPVPDQRLDRLFADFPKSREVQAKIEYFDPYLHEPSPEDAIGPSLNAVKGASVLGLVVRGFENPNVPYIFQTIDLKRAVAVSVERMFEADIVVCERRVEKIDVIYLKAKSDDLERERAIIVKCLDHLRGASPLSRLELSPEERAAIQSIEFLTAKPLLIVLNVDEKDASTERLKKIAADFKPLAPQYASVVALCARLERELLELEEEDRAMFMQDAGLADLAKERIIRASYDATETICFFTIGNDEVRAWPLRAGTTAIKAAGTVHTDMARGFIRAEVIAFDDYVKADSMREVKAQKLNRLEGKDYVVADGDIIEFRFHV
ncbi:MAG TPA: DUF933 domain-containing protein [bacterium]|nr:DUF933 domain-containing protein [bacterium]